MKVLFENDEIKVERAAYSNCRPMLILLDKSNNYHQAISVNPDWVKVNKEQVIVRDYAETKGIYNFLVQNKIVGADKRDVSIGINKAVACKLLTQ